MQKHDQFVQHSLDPKRLLAEAQKIAQLSDYGSRNFIAPMTRYLERASNEVDFVSGGLMSFRADILRFLVNRLRIREDIQNHPEILQEDVSDPLIVIGLPRSGTTKMQRILSSAPNTQKLFLWRLLNPARFPNSMLGQHDPRKAAAGMGDGMGSDVADQNMALQAAHELAAGQVEEEFVLFDFVLDESIRGFGPYLPLFFYEWEAGRDREIDREAYRYLRMLLQYLQWQDGGKSGRPWIMKSVSHIAHMDSLLEFFPAATLVHCHRDPSDAVPSLAKFQVELWSMKAKVDKKIIGREALKWCSLAMSRYLESRERLQLDDRILDVSYEDIRNGIMPVIREAYQRAGWPLTVGIEQSLLAWEADNEQGKRGEHNYSLEEFGLTEAMIKEHFSNYITQFIELTS